ncbi:TetR/AcrR family transcriptional regulator [Nocardioides sp.]|uniref:TetR/AcrR family transcriptional regulator n=1 Tax=Nocardioides sp. TaxID=35761 RepID=UPI003D10C330
MSEPTRHLSAAMRDAASESVTLTPILSAALDAFYESGYHGSTVRDIAKRVGVTVPALYYHHENKEALLFALLDGSINRLLGLCEEVRDSISDPRSRFLALVELLIRYTAASRRLNYLDAEIRSLSPEHYQAQSSKRAGVQDVVVSAVEQGALAGQFDVDHPRDTVRALLGMIQAIATWYRPSGPLTVDELVERYLTLALRMVGAHDFS